MNGVTVPTTILIFAKPIVIKIQIVKAMRSLYPWNLTAILPPPHNVHMGALNMTEEIRGNCSMTSNCIRIFILGVTLKIFDLLSMSQREI